jgi:threonine synthase
MPRPSSLACVRCTAHYPLDHYSSACAACAERNIASNLTVCYDAPPGGDLRRHEVRSRPRSQWRWDAFLAAPATDAVTLGEGDTPLLPAPALGLGDVWIKDESRNPTWSFKDRLASSAVTMARAQGARLIASSSSGNAGASAAAYAARAGLPCIVFTFKGAAGPLLTQMRAYGAMVLMVENKDDRWRLQSAGVRTFGWYSTSPFFGPVIGSNPYGMEGYKTIAYEIAEAFDWVPPDWCVLPVCYGDALHGMWKGFEELKTIGWIDRVPRFVAAEVSGSLAAALSAGDAAPMPRPRNAGTIATSIGADRGTVQALEVLRRTDGAAVAVDDDVLIHWAAKLASAEGIWAEPSSVAPLAAIDALRREGTIRAEERVVALVTASGLKDMAPIEKALPPAPIVSGNLDDVLRALHDNYGFRHD